VLLHTNHTFHTNILDQITTMNDDGSILQPSKSETGNSQPTESSVTNTLTQNGPQELLLQSGKSVDTIGLEAALMLLPVTFSGANQDDLELFLE